MPKVKLDPDDLEAVLAIVDVCVGKRSAGCQFVDRRDTTRLAPYYSVAVMNCENVLREHRKARLTDRKRTVKISDRLAT